MAVAQTLAHCTSGIEMAMGVIHAKRAPFPANLIARLSSRWSSATTGRCVATRPHRWSCSQRAQQTVNS
jgi:hypothetical protein